MILKCIFNDCFTPEKNNLRRFVNSVLTLTALTCTLNAQTAGRGSTADDLPHRDTAIHWPKGFEPTTAPLFSHNELLIRADASDDFRDTHPVAHYGIYTGLTAELVTFDA